MMTLVDRQQTKPLMTLVYVLVFVLIVVTKESSCIDFQGHPYSKLYNFIPGQVNGCLLYHCFP